MPLIIVEYNNLIDSWLITEAIVDNINLQQSHQASLDNNKIFLEVHPKKILNVYTDRSLIVEKSRSSNGIAKHMGAGCGLSKWINIYKALLLRTHHQQGENY